MNRMINRNTPTVIEIDTVDGYCTRNCTVCPISQIRTKNYMTIDLFKEILLDLNKWKEIKAKRIKFDLTPFGEFFLHPHWHELLELTSKYMIDFKTYLHTNADKLCIKDIDYVMTHINTLIIDVYEPKNDITTDIFTLSQQLKNTNINIWQVLDNAQCINIQTSKILKGNVYSNLITHNKKNIVFLNNQKIYNNKNSIHQLKNWSIFDKNLFGKFTDISCSSPMRQLVLNSYGNMILCCVDILQQYIFGNINLKNNATNESYYKNEYLNNRYLNEIRALLRVGLNGKKRSLLPLCRNCTDKTGAKRIGIEKIDTNNSDYAAIGRYFENIRPALSPVLTLDMDTIHKKQEKIRSYKETQDAK